MPSDTACDGRQHDHVLLQHGLKRLLQLAQRGGSCAGAARNKNFAFAFSRSAAAKSWPASSAFRRPKRSRLAHFSGMHECGFLFDDAVQLGDQIGHLRDGGFRLGGCR